MLKFFILNIAIFFSLLQVSISQSINTVPHIPNIVSSISISDYEQNPAKTLYNQRNNIALCYTPSAFGLSELNQNSLIATYGDSNLVHLARINGSFGNLFTYTNVSYSIAYNLFDSFAPFISMNYSYLKIKDHNDFGSLTFDIGGILELDKNLKFGFSISNLLNSSLETNPDFAKQNATFGLQYSFTNDFSMRLGTQIILESHSGLILGFIKDFDDLIKLGLSYLTEPEMIEANISFKSISNLRILYNLNYHNQLGATHQFGLEYQFD